MGDLSGHLLQRRRLRCEAGDGAGLLWGRQDRVWGEDTARWDGEKLPERLGRRTTDAAELAPLVQVPRFLPDVGCSWPEQPEEKGLPWCLITGCSCISRSSSLRRKQACSDLKRDGGNYDKNLQVPSIPGLGSRQPEERGRFAQQGWSRATPPARPRPHRLRLPSGPRPQIQHGWAEPPRPVRPPRSPAAAEVQPIRKWGSRPASQSREGRRLTR